MGPGKVRRSVISIGKPQAAPRPARAGLDAGLASEVPSPLEIGRGTALLLEGHCADRRAEIAELCVLVDDAEHPVRAHGMPRPGRIDRGDWWWAVVPFEAHIAPGSARLRLRARLRGGGEAGAELGAIEIAPRARAPAGAADGLSPAAWPPGAAPALGKPLVAVCMATYEPRRELFERQVESIRAQTYRTWVCVIADDGSSPQRLAEMKDVLGADPRFVLVEHADRVGFYRNFERALRRVPDEAELVALCDQDDRWRPDKLEALTAALEPGPLLAYSDMRVVDDGGKVLSETFWTGRRNNHTDFTSLLIANTVTGAASLMRRELLDYALPFPPLPGRAFHDRWIALCALALGQIAYVERPLTDYVQHAAAEIGHAGANTGMRLAGESRVQMIHRRASRLARRRFRPGWRRLYFERYLRTVLEATVLDLRCGGRMEPKKRRAVSRLIEAERSITGLPWLAARSLRPLAGANETLATERVLLRALVWRRLAGARSRLFGRG